MYASPSFYRSFNAMEYYMNVRRIILGLCSCFPPPLLCHSVYEHVPDSRKPQVRNQNRQSQTAEGVAASPSVGGGLPWTCKWTGSTNTHELASWQACVGKCALPGPALHQQLTADRHGRSAQAVPQHQRRTRVRPRRCHCRTALRLGQRPTQTCLRWEPAPRLRTLSPLELHKPGAMYD